MADTEEDQTWLLALEAALPECSDDEEIINITRGRTLPEEHRTQIWQLCLGGAHKTSSFTHFDGIFDLQEQDLIRADCKVLVDKLDNEEEDKVTIMCSVESIFTHYCKSRGLRYEPAACWNHLLLPLLAAKMPADTAAFCFQELLEKYVPRENGLGAPVYHLLRLLLLYHDPELSTFLDSRKITPDLYAMKWVRSLFASVCDLQSVLAVWDVYLAEKDPFFVLFLAIVILVNAREQILAMEGQNKADIVSTLMSVPASLRTQDVQDFCALARFYVYRTPSTYRKDFEREIFGSVYLGGGREKKKRRKEEEEEEEEEEERDRETDLPLSQALCLSVSPEEILELSHSLPAADDDYDQVGFFLVDCRPAHQYNSGHIPTAFHLDPTLMLHQPPQFATAVQGLLLCQKCAVASRTAGQHLCFIGAGREEEDKYLNMVMAFFLQRSTRLVCVARGGYAALHDLLVHDLTSLADHDPKKCLVCAPPSPVPLDQAGQSESRILDGAKVSANGRPGSEGLANDGAAGVTNRFSSLSAVFKSRSAEMKDKLFDYITNPSGGDYTTTTTTTTTTATAATTTTTNARHISSQDKGKLYRQGDIFSIEDEEEDGNEEEGRDRRERERERERESLERVDFKELLKRKDFVNYFSCQQIKENGYLLKSVLVLTASQLLVVREGGRVSLLAAERSLASILKITSKKRHPDLITFKYGTSSEGEAMLVTDMDRFLIPKASQATKAIKEQILKQMQEPKP